MILGKKSAVDSVIVSLLSAMRVCVHVYSVAQEREVEGTCSADDG